MGAWINHRESAEESFIHPIASNKTTIGRCKPSADLKDALGKSRLPESLGNATEEVSRDASSWLVVISAGSHCCAAAGPRRFQDQFGWDLAVSFLNDA